MDEHQHHEELIKEVAEQFAEILKGSKQSIYIYLDDIHKTCNEKFSTLLGYNTVDEWATVKHGFTDAFVANESQETLVSAYQKAMEDFAGSKIDVVWKKKDGENVESKVIIVPIAFQGHILAIHFISDK